MPTVTVKPVRTSEKAKDMLRFDLENENETIKSAHTRVRQCNRSVNLPWPSLFGRFSLTSRTTKSTWRRRWVWKSRMWVVGGDRPGNGAEWSPLHPEGVMSRNGAALFCERTTNLELPHHRLWR